MPTFNLGNVVGILPGTTAPAKLYILWQHILNSAYPNEFVVKRYNIVTSAWESLAGILPTFKDILGTPPVSPSVGDVYLVTSSGTTGAFVGKENNQAQWLGHSWVFVMPKIGDVCKLLTNLPIVRIYNGSTWILFNFVLGSSFTFTSVDGTKTFNVQMDDSGAFFTTEI